jgi:hypothetical protein
MKEETSGRGEHPLPTQVQGEADSNLLGPEEDDVEPLGPIIAARWGVLILMPSGTRGTAVPGEARCISISRVRGGQKDSSDQCMVCNRD